MANVVPGEDAQLSFPLPPLHFYQHYTNENVKNDLAPKPPKVVVGEYSMYGHIFKTDDQIIQPLESQGIMRLYSKEEDFDHIVEMKKLNHSILVNYLELVDIMIYAPASPERQKKIEEIKVLFINLHHLINEFRPHQARETLRVLLHRQKQQTLETADRLRRNIEKARSLLAAAGNLLQQPVVKNELQSIEDSDPTLSAEEKLKDLYSLREKLMCDLLDDIS
ncbi:mediator of RNA polymerase II transcription subunit 7 isoform X2 [Hydra vulgaris]|uniref:Mediator of RNA polymerase II transcription subunit 7 n=1 Tax=Hydra vulgaris TaxID=6087 RepID=T2MI62_HYDVU|nr:mediator of RNA polymerase II transcription subunit 7 isoform X3 [Hydra vulgaris]